MSEEPNHVPQSLMAVSKGKVLNQTDKRTFAHPKVPRPYILTEPAFIHGRYRKRGESVMLDRHEVAGHMKPDGWDPKAPPEVVDGAFTETTPKLMLAPPDGS